MRFILLTTLFFATVLYEAQGATIKRTGGANADQPEVEAVLAEIRELIKTHYKVPPPKNRVQPSEEDLAAADLLDDIRYTVDQARAILNDMKRRWGYEVREDRIIPNETLFWKLPIKWGFNGDHNEDQKKIIRAGFQLWMDNSCLMFEEHNASELVGQPHLYIIQGSGCWSYVGNIYPDRQELSIGVGCERVGTVAHEIDHAMGISHEFSRPDRDQHVTVFWENIIAGKEHNFMIKEDWDPANTGYDVSSVMHYDSLGFSIDSANKKRVMMPHDLHQLTAIGQRARLQFNDIKRINYAYKCVDQCTPSQLTAPCKNGGYQDPKNCAVCRCPPGTTGDDCSLTPPGNGDGFQSCGGEVWLDHCEIRSITIPTYPKPYGEETGCTWRINTAGKGLVFAFESLPDMACSKADTCYDFVEIRTAMSRLDSPGRFFCTCGESKGRIVSVDQSEALVRWASTTLIERSGAGKNIGFVLNVYSTCNDTLASEVPNSCTITTTGFESCSKVSMPLCDADILDFIEPVDPPTTTGAPTTTQAALPSTTSSSSAVLGSLIVVMGAFMAALIPAF